MNNDISPLPYIGAFIALIFIILSLGFSKPAHASLNLDAFNRDFQAEAARTYSFSNGRTASFYKNTDDEGYGFRIGGMLDASDRATGFTAPANLERNATLTTLLLNGTYDLPGFDPNLILRPYVLAGAGLAVYDTSAANLAPEERGTSIVPVFKLGGGLAFRMGQVMDLTFSYKAGFAGAGSAMGHSEGSTLQMVDIALKYKF